MTDLPGGLSIEPVWLVEVPYTPDAPRLRPPHRLVHLGRIADLIREGTVIEAGGCSDWTKAVLLVRGASAAEVIALIEDDVYTREGVWHDPTATRFGRVVPDPVAVGEETATRP
jgi:uncharacterized protein YciI